MQTLIERKVVTLEMKEEGKKGDGRWKEGKKEKKEKEEEEEEESSSGSEVEGGRRSVEGSTILEKEG